MKDLYISFLKRHFKNKYKIMKNWDNIQNKKDQVSHKEYKMKFLMEEILIITITYLLE